MTDAVDRPRFEGTGKDLFKVFGGTAKDVKEYKKLLNYPGSPNVKKNKMDKAKLIANGEGLKMLKNLHDGLAFTPVQVKDLMGMVFDANCKRWGCRRNKEEETPRQNV